MKRDWSTRAGAYELAEIIRRHWHTKGYLVEVRVTADPRATTDLHDHHGEGLFGVRSNLVNGLPQ